MNRTLNVMAQVALSGFLTFAPAASYAAGDFLYTETRTASSYTTLIGPIPISGLSLNLPAASTRFNAAIVTLNMPNLFLSQNTSRTIPMAATLFIVAPFSPLGVLQADGGIGCDNVAVSTSGVKPLTIVLKVPLGTGSQLVEAEWFSNGTSTVTNQTFASISAILVKE